MDHARATRSLGAYLLVMFVYQMSVYLWPGGASFLLDPRIGFGTVLVGTWGLNHIYFRPLEWATAMWLLLLACALVLRKPLLVTYVVSELLLSALSVYWLMVLVVVGGGHFFTSIMILVPALILIMFTALPVGFAVYSLRPGH